MRISRGRDCYPLKPFHDIVHVLDLQTRILLVFVPMAAMLKMKEETGDLVGEPLYWAIDDHRMLFIHPTPERTGRLAVRYLPPMREQ